MKICIICNIEKPITEFHKNRKETYDCRCKSCKSEIARTRRNEDYFKSYCSTKKAECKKKSYDFDLTPEYLQNIWTGVCPIFGIPIVYGQKGMGSHNSAHLDRTDSSKGYVVGNVNWISGRANRIKYDATIEELRKIADWMESVTTRVKTCTPEADAGGSGEPLETE